MTVPFDPMDPLGVVRYWTEKGRQAQDAVNRITAQQRQAQRAARLAACVTDVATAYAAFIQAPDEPSAANLAGAVEQYRKVAADA